MGSCQDSHPSLLQANGMGINFSFCSGKAYLSRERLPKEESSYGKVSLVVWIVQNIKQTCLLRKRTQKKNKEGKQQLKMGNELSLEEWLLNSPIMENDGNCNSGHCGFKHCSGGDYPSVVRERTYLSDSGKYGLSLDQLFSGGDYSTLSVDYSISSENVLKDEKGDVKEVFNSLARSESGKVKKRVSFRLPEVSDTIILYH